MECIILNYRPTYPMGMVYLPTLTIAGQDTIHRSYQNAVISVNIHITFNEAKPPPDTPTIRPYYTKESFFAKSLEHIHSFKGDFP